MIRNAVFAGLLLLAILIALAGLVALLVQAFVKGSAGAQPRPVHQPALDAIPRKPASARRSSARSS